MSRSECLNRVLCFRVTDSLLPHKLSIPSLSHGSLLLYPLISLLFPYQFGILSFILQRNEQCHLKAMILVWTDRQFCGIIPNDQVYVLRHRC